MDENVKKPSSSRETTRNDLASPEPKPEICEQSEPLATSSTSASENIPIVSLESVPNIKSKMVERKLSPCHTKDILNDARTISSYVEQILNEHDEQEQCNVHVKEINEKIKIHPNYLNIRTLPAEELVQRLKPLTAISRKIADFEKRRNRLLSLIEGALRSIRQNLPHPFSSDRVVYVALKSVQKYIKDINEKQEEHKSVLTKIKESLEKKFPLPALTAEDVVNEFNYLKVSVDLFVAEINGRDTHILNIIALLNSMKEIMSP